MKHTSHYQWRTYREQEKEVGPDFLCKGYDATIPHTERCGKIEQDHIERYLMHEGYKDHQPYKSPDWMRTDDPASEIHPPRRYGNRTENERILQEIKKVCTLVDHSSKNCKMLYSPHWKNGYKTKKKWKTSRGFDLTT
jgi:hypothetical protein